MNAEIEPIIRATGLSKNYSGTPALDGLDLALPSGPCGLLGENGAGKTTFIKLILGLLRPNAGRLEVLGCDVGTEGIALRQLVGYAPEDECLPPDLSALDLVIRMGRLSGLPREAAVQRAYDVLNLVELDEARYRPIGGYSSGMKQRVKLAQALIHDPKLVLLDEPTSGLDPEGRQEMLALVADIHRKMGMNLLLSTHLLGDVEQICEHVVILRAGRVVAQGTLADLLQESGPKVWVRVAGDEYGFRSALEAAGVEVASSPGGGLLVTADRDEVYDEILKVAAETGIQLRRLEPQSRSLEEVFLAAQGSS